MVRRDTTDGDEEATREQIRGSSLLLSGRFIALGLNFASQVLVVRFLTTTDYGAWAYGLSVVALLQAGATLGLHRAITRFVPIYQEEQAWGKLVGAILLVVGSLGVAALVLIAGFHALSAPISRLMAADAAVLPLLSIMIFLVPVEALDAVLIGLFASFSKPRAIFFRKHVLGPGLRLLVVLALVLRESDVVFLAYGYLAASALGVAIYGAVLMRLLRREGILRESRRQRLRFPAREIFAFSVPMMTSDLLVVFITASAALLLGYFGDLEQVAVFQVVVPLALLNLLVKRTFALLYTPTAARLFARSDHEGLGKLYRRTTLWMATLSFPVFAATFSLASPLTRLLYGERYEGSALVLAILALGFYFTVALGFNDLTLKVLGRLRVVMAIDVAGAIVNLLAGLVLIPALGVVGAAAASCLTLVALTLARQTALSVSAGITLLAPGQGSFYWSIGAATVALSLLQIFDYRGAAALAIPAALGSLFVLLLNRKRLHLAETFPEIARLPLMRVIFA